MAEFNDTPTNLFDWDSATELERGKAAYDELVASEVLQVEPMAPPRPPATPQITRIDQALAALPLLVLAVVLLLLLAACSDDGRESIKAQRDRQYSQLATADVAPTAPAPIVTQTAPMDTAAVIDSQPCPNVVVPAQLPPRPANLAPQCGEPGGPEGECWPTPEYLPPQCPCATNAEIDAALQSNEPWTCPSNGGAQ